MQDEYDFSKGERGKFYTPGAQMNFPVYLEKEVMNYFSEKARAKGVDIGALVNDVLKKDIALIQEVQ